MVVAADRRQARVVHRYVRGLIHGNPMLRRMVVRETEEIIELNNRSAIEIGTASFRSIRGYSISCAVLDEVAYWQIDGANPDAEVLAGIRPALATLKGKLVAISSPYARRGVLWNVFRKHYGGDDRRILVAKAPTLVMNPTIDPEIVAAALEEDAAAASAEWLAEFRSDVETFASREVIEGCVEFGVRERAPLARYSYSAFVDPSGGSSEFNDAGDRPCRARRRGGAGCPGLPSGAPGTVQSDRGRGRVRGGLEVVSHPPGPRRQVRRRVAGGGVPEAGDQLPGYRSAEERFYRDLLPLLNSRRVDLLDEPRFLAQLVGLERRTARGGRDSIDHSPGAHDDVANAVAGALVLVGAARCNGPVVVGWPQFKGFY